MNIGIDLDEVTADFFGALLKFYHKKKGKLYTKEDFTKFEWWPKIGANREEAIKIVDEFHETHNLEDVIPLEHAVDSILNLLKNHKLIVITGRPLRFKAKTEQWVNHHIRANIKIIHAGEFHKGQAETKAQICQKLKIPILLEDAPETALDCANSGVKVILFEMPWNRHIKHKNIIRVKNWLEAVEEIEHFKSIK